MVIMIPKTIHYCWFGAGNMPSSSLKYVEEWQKILPEYVFKLWNEENFDVNLYKYASDAHADGKYAFVADVCRIHALYYEGGVYLDVDIQLIKDLSALLNHKAFGGFEATTIDILSNEKMINSQMGVVGSEPYGEWVQKILDKFRNTDYDKKNNITINKIVNDIIIKDGFKLIDQIQFIDNYLYLYPSSYFICKDCYTGVVEKKEHTYCIHHYNASWLKINDKFNLKIKNILIKYLDIRLLRFFVVKLRSIKSRY